MLHQILSRMRYGSSYTFHFMNTFFSYTAILRRKMTFTWHWYLVSVAAFMSRSNLSLAVTLARYIHDVCNGLSHNHEYRSIHQDVKNRESGVGVWWTCEDLILERQSLWVNTQIHCTALEWWQCWWYVCMRSHSSANHCLACCEELLEIVRLYTLVSVLFISNRK